MFGAAFERAPHSRRTAGRDDLVANAKRFPGGPVLGKRLQADAEPLVACVLCSVEQRGDDFCVHAEELSNTDWFGAFGTRHLAVVERKDECLVCGVDDTAGEALPGRDYLQIAGFFRSDFAVLENFNELLEVGQCTGGCAFVDGVDEGEPRWTEDSPLVARSVAVNRSQSASERRTGSG